MSRAARFDLADFETRRVKADKEPQPQQPSIIWPLPKEAILQVGETVMARRRGSNRPHKGVDIFVPPNTPVVAASEGRVLRVIDGRGSSNPDLRRAGLFVDVLVAVVPFDGLWVHRYLHLWKTTVKSRSYVEQGARIALTGTAGATGIEHSRPHIHFEVRQAIQDTDGHISYGDPVDPLKVLPVLQRGDRNA